MKTITLILFATLFMANNAFSQNWVSDSAVWHYDFSFNGMGFYKIQIGGDTVIENKSCQSYNIQKYIFWPQPNGSYTFGGKLQLSNRYTYTHGDTVFEYRNGHFFTLFNFGALPGDQWVISTDVLISSACDTFSTVKVTDTAKYVINGNSLRAIKLEPVFGSPLGIYGWVIEKIGPISTYLFPVGQNCDSNLIIDFELGAFKCFSDSVVGSYNPSGGECEYLLNHLGLNENSQLENTIIIFPNPATSEIALKLPNENLSIQKVNIYDQMGRKVLSFNDLKLSQTLNIQKLATGKYFVEIISKESTVYSGVFIKGDTGH